ncbi:hypothetical protein BTVI_73512 [Pitangus sulphuratus]|nr:hypothetical protein BTVI_73512 [Pitangus sulphuratus]
MFKGKVPSMHHATDATWSKWIALITQCARIGNLILPGILEIIMNWPEGENFCLAYEEEGEQVGRTKNVQQPYGVPHDKWQKLLKEKVIHDCEICAAIKQAKRLKPLWYGGCWNKYRYGETWQVDDITLPYTRQGKRYVLIMVEATTGWLEIHPVPHATATNTILGLEKQVLW